MFSPRDVWRGRSLQAMAGVPEWRNLAEPESLFSFCRQTSKFENCLRSLVSNIVNDSKNMWVCKRYVWWHCSIPVNATYRCKFIDVWLDSPIFYHLANSYWRRLLKRGVTSDQPGPRLAWVTTGGDPSGVQGSTSWTSMFRLGVKGHSRFAATEESTSSPIMDAAMSTAVTWSGSKENGSAEFLSDEEAGW